MKEDLAAAAAVAAGTKPMPPMHWNLVILLDLPTESDTAQSFDAGPTADFAGITPVVVLARGAAVGSVALVNYLAAVDSTARERWAASGGFAGLGYCAAVLLHWLSVAEVSIFEIPAD